MNKLIFAVLLTARFGAASSLPYSNTAVDQGFSVFYSTAGYTEIGDQIHLISATLAASAAVQFYNVGTDATFDATLRFYNVGAPVGAQIGGPFTVTGISILGGGSQTVNFPDLGSLGLPQDLIVTLAVANVSAGGDIGVNLFDPPETGSSSNTFFIGNDGTGFSQLSTNLGVDNVYLQVSASAPEPSTAGVTFGLLAALAYYKMRKRQAAV